MWTQVHTKARLRESYVDDFSEWAHDRRASRRLNIHEKRTSRRMYALAYHAAVRVGRDAPPRETRSRKKAHTGDYTRQKLQTALGS